MSLRLAVALHHSRDLAKAVTLAVAADRLGYDSVWVPEAYGSDALTILGYIAARTDFIGLGTGVLQMPARTPANTAMSAMTLDELSGGRLRLGLGVSGPQVVEGWHGVPYGKPLTMTREYVEIVRQIVLREQPLQFAGKVFRIPIDVDTAPLKSSMRPYRQQIPIYLAANGPRNIALAAEIAEGWLPTMYAPEHDDLVAGPIAEGTARRDAAVAPLVIATALQAFIGPDVDACRDLARPYLALYIGGMGSRGKNFYNDIVVRYGYGDAAKVVQDLYLDGRHRDAGAAIPDELVDKLALVGPPGRIKDRLRIWADSRVEELVIRSSDVSVLETLRGLVDDL